MAVYPAQHVPYNKVEAEAAARDGGRIAPVEPTAVERLRRVVPDGYWRIGRGLDNDRWKKRVIDHAPAIVGGWAGLVDEAALGGVEGLRVLLVAGREHARGIASAGAVVPVAHPSPTAARARAVGIAEGIVHTGAPDTGCARRCAHAPVFAFAARGGLLALHVAGPKQFVQQFLFPAVNVGVLRLRLHGQREQQQDPESE